MSRCLRLACLLSFAAAGCLAQSDVFWDDPRLEEAVRDADLVVRAQAVEVGAHEVRYTVLETLKGPDRKGATVRVAGLFHPDLADGPPSVKDEQAFLILRGEASGDSFLVPTPTFGRFPIRRFGKSEQAVACLGDTFVRLPLEPDFYAAFLRGVAKGSSDELSTRAREGLQAQLEAEAIDSTTLYVNLRLLAGGGDTTMVYEPPPAVPEEEAAEDGVDAEGPAEDAEDAGEDAQDPTEEAADAGEEEDEGA